MQESKYSIEPESIRQFSKKRKRTLTVARHSYFSLFGGSHYRTIADAVTAARPGDRISIQAGVYEERLVFDGIQDLVLSPQKQDGVVELRAPPKGCSLPLVDIRGGTSIQFSHFKFTPGSAHLTTPTTDQPSPTFSHSHCDIDIDIPHYSLVTIRPQPSTSISTPIPHINFQHCEFSNSPISKEKSSFFGHALMCHSSSGNAAAVEPISEFPDLNHGVQVHLTLNTGSDQPPKEDSQSPIAVESLINYSSQFSSNGDSPIFPTPVTPLNEHSTRLFHADWSEIQSHGTINLAKPTTPNNDLIVSTDHKIPILGLNSTSAGGDRDPDMENGEGGKMDSGVQSSAALSGIRLSALARQSLDHQKIRKSHTTFKNENRKSDPTSSAVHVSFDHCSFLGFHGPPALSFSGPTSTISVNNSEFSENNVGLLISHGATCEIQKSNFSRNHRCGTLISNGGNCKIVDCEFFKNFGNGVECVCIGSNLSIFDSTLHNNEWHGMEIWDHGVVQVSKTTMFNNRRDNAKLCRSVGTFSECGFQASRWSGVHTDQGSQSSFVDCKFLGNNSGGLLCSNASQFSMTRCSVKENTFSDRREDGFGIAVIGTSQGTADECVFSGNTGDGATVRGGSGVAFAQCSFASNNARGLSFFDGSFGEMKRCRVECNVEGQVQVEEEARCLVSSDASVVRKTVGGPLFLMTSSSDGDLQYSQISSKLLDEKGFYALQ